MNLYNKLLDNKETIEKACGFSLDWQELSEKKASRISIKENVDFNNRNEWYNQFDWIIDKLLKMKKTFKPYI